MSELNSHIATLALKMATQALDLIYSIQQSEKTVKDGRDGVDGKDGVDGLDGKDGAVGATGEPGRDGLNGRDGVDGEMGPMPDHEIKGNSIRFQKPDGTWGKWVELGGQSGGGGGGDVMRYQINTFTSSTVQLKDNHSTVLCDASSNQMTVTLPRAGSMVGRVVTVKKIDSSANTVTIDGYKSETIDGDTTTIITKQWTSLRLQSDGNNWVIM
jgi:hypothetical protein